MGTSLFNPKEFGLVCAACGYHTTNDQEFREHCLNEHREKNKDCAMMECRACDFKTNSSLCFYSHLEKKMHAVNSYYASHVEYFLGDEEMAYDATFKKFGFRSAGKASFTYRVKKRLEKDSEQQTPELLPENTRM